MALARRWRFLHLRRCCSMAAAVIVVLGACAVLGAGFATYGSDRSAWMNKIKSPFRLRLGPSSLAWDLVCSTTPAASLRPICRNQSMRLFIDAVGLFTASVGASPWLVVSSSPCLVKLAPASSTAAVQSPSSFDAYSTAKEFRAVMVAILGLLLELNTVVSVRRLCLHRHHLSPARSIEVSRCAFHLHFAGNCSPLAEMLQQGTVLGPTLHIGQDYLELSVRLIHAWVEYMFGSMMLASVYQFYQGDRLSPVNPTTHLRLNTLPPVPQSTSEAFGSLRRHCPVIVFADDSMGHHEDPSDTFVDCKLVCPFQIQFAKLYRVDVVSTHSSGFLPSTMGLFHVIGDLFLNTMYSVLNV